MGIQEWEGDQWIKVKQPVQLIASEAFGVKINSIPARRFTAESLPDNAWLLTATYEDKFVGYAYGTPLEPGLGTLKKDENYGAHNTAYLRLAIAPHYENLGLATYLRKDFLESARQRGFQYVTEFRLAAQVIQDAEIVSKIKRKTDEGLFLYTRTATEKPRPDTLQGNPDLASGRKLNPTGRDITHTPSPVYIDRLIEAAAEALHDASPVPLDPLYAAAIIILHQQPAMAKLDHIGRMLKYTDTIIAYNALIFLANKYYLHPREEWNNIFKRDLTILKVKNDLHEYVHYLLRPLVDFKLLKADEAHKLAQWVDDRYYSTTNDTWFHDSDDNERTEGRNVFKRLWMLYQSRSVSHPESSQVIDPLQKAMITIPKMLRSPFSFVKRINSLEAPSTDPADQDELAVIVEALFGKLPIRADVLKFPKSGEPQQPNQADSSSHILGESA